MTVSEINDLVKKHICNPYLVFLPALDLKDAWRVVEALGDQYDCTIERYAEDGTVSCSFYGPESDKTLAEATADRAAMAICLAALRLKGVEVE